MPKGLIFTSNTGTSSTTTYGFISNSKVYTPEVEAATGMRVANDLLVATPVPYRIPDLLQSGVLKSITVVLNDGAGKQTSRTIFISKDKASTIRLSKANGGLVGATVAGKIVKSVTIPRKSSFALP